MTDQSSNLRQLNAARGTFAALNAEDRLTFLSEVITGMSVSIDISTGDADAGNRLFGNIHEVMSDNHDRHGATLLVYETTSNVETST